jgi:TolA-binding protein
MNKWQNYVFLIALMGTSVSCDYIGRVERRASELNALEDKSAALAMKNQELKNEIDRLKFQVSKMETEHQFLQVQLEESNDSKVSRSIASVAKFVPKNEDHVKYDIYQWTPDQIKAIAKSEFKKENYVKAAQFYKAFSLHYPNHAEFDDEFLFNAGVAAYESGRYHKWTLDHLNELVSQYPTSKYYRGAKLWMALTHLQMGKRDQFFETVEEFRKKYRNTPEWDILSAHYEKIVQDFKN